MRSEVLGAGDRVSRCPTGHLPRKRYGRACLGTPPVSLKPPLPTLVFVFDLFEIGVDHGLIGRLTGAGFGTARFGTARFG